MANIDDRLPENILGRFFVTSDCIDCDVCREHAPDFFRRNDEIGLSVVFRQPQTDAEVTLCEEAMESCPVEAIGSTEMAEA